MSLRPFTAAFAFLPLVMVSLCAEAAAADVGAEVKSLEDHALAARRAVKSGEFEVRIKSSDSQVEVQYHIWLGADGQIRQERNLGEEFQVSIFDAQFAYYYVAHPGRSENANLTARAAIERVPVAQARRDTIPHLICDPRVCMFVPVQFSLLSHYPSLEAMVGGPGRENVTVSPTTWNELPAETVRFSHPKTGNQYEYDVVPSRDYNVVRWRLTGAYGAKDGGETRFDDTLTSELTNVAGAGWFPTRIVERNLRNGNVDLEQEVTIVPKLLNQPIPENVFTLGWKLAEKQLVVQHSVYGGPSTAPATQGALLWDGERLRPFTRKDAAERRARVVRAKVAATAAQADRASRLFFGMGAAAIVVAVVIVTWALRSGTGCALLAVVSLMLGVAGALLWVRSYRTIDEAFLIYAVDGSEEVSSMDGRILIQHFEPEDGVRGGPLRVSHRAAEASMLPPRYWPTGSLRKTFWPGVTMMSAARSGAEPAYWAVVVPMWQVEILLACMSVVWIAEPYRRFRRRRQGRCVECGYSLRANVSGVCPECGAGVG